MKIAVAMSGGVDSSVAVAILQKKGNDVIGVTMRHYDSVAYGFSEAEGINAAIKDAKEVCKKLGIAHHVIDTSEVFKKIVEENFISEYSRGRTPNPCILCNPTIKWGVFLEEILKLGVEIFATGHYVKLIEEEKAFHIYKASDENKDQSYMLWRLTQQQLSKTLFPLADFSKSEVRKIATEMKLPVHEKSESQEICFIKSHYEDFLKDHLELSPGKIVLPDGKIIGTHRGLPLYTIGQRKGLNTPWRCPLYVLKLDVEKKELIVTDNPDDLLCDRFTIKNINWINKEPSADISVQIRYNSKPVPVKKLEYKKDTIQVNLVNPVRAITPGQSAVFYLEDQLLGGGIIV
jgi:tRNA-specific 2-thiouridylase